MIRHLFRCATRLLRDTSVSDHFAPSGSTNVALIGALHSGPVPVEARLIGYDDKPPAHAARPPFFARRRRAKNGGGAIARDIRRLAGQSADHRHGVVGAVTRNGFRSIDTSPSRKQTVKQTVPPQGSNSWVVCDDDSALHGRPDANYSGTGCSRSCGFTVTTGTAMDASEIGTAEVLVAIGTRRCLARRSNAATHRPELSLRNCSSGCCGLHQVPHVFPLFNTLEQRAFHLSSVVVAGQLHLPQSQFLGTVIVYGTFISHCVSRERELQTAQ